MTTHRNYLGWMLATMLGASMAVAGFVLLVDPYGLYGLVDRPGFNRVKPPVERYRNEIRQDRADRLRPGIVIVGNSRMEVGIDPDGLPLAGRNAFNLGLAGSGTVTAIGQLRHMAAGPVPPRRVIAGIDFVDALTEQPVHPVRPAALPQPAVVRTPGWRDQLWRADTLYSFASLQDALLTVAIQHNPDAAATTLRGHNPLRQYHQAARVEGYAALFSQRAAENTRRLAAAAHGGLQADEVRADVAALIDAAAAANPDVAIDLVIYPYHAQLLALFERARLWPRFEAWKEILVSEAEAGRRRHARARVTVHDFSGFGPLQCEQIPPAGSKAGTRWYWEAGHFKAALGDVMVARVLGTAGNDAPAGFGVRLDRGTLAHNRERIAAERAGCAARQADLFDGVARDVEREQARQATARGTAAQHAGLASVTLK